MAWSLCLKSIYYIAAVAIAAAAAAAAAAAVFPFPDSNGCYARMFAHYTYCHCCSLALSSIY